MRENHVVIIGGRFGELQFRGIAHFYFLIGSRSRFAVAWSWFWIYISGQHCARLITQKDAPAGRGVVRPDISPGRRIQADFRSLSRCAICASA